ncbi:alpha/beta fold hydrolase [Ideonella sp.]|uniref:alpha/beta fold hydrolase n=1 Tax=Ideonella sp. TaxID=1929293 RepID=UPI0037C0E702
MQPGLGLAAQPFYLDTRGGSVLCWWHAPAQAAVAHPVLMCPTWGDEEIGAYAGWRALALSLAQQGVPVLRLDLPGEGDSLARPSGASAWSSWVDALEDAASALRQVTGAPKVHLLGLRLGALMAAQVADRLRQRADLVASLLLVAPVASGRAFLREARLLSQGAVDEPLQEGEAVAGGFVLDARSAQAVGAAQWPTLLAQRHPAPCPVTILERSDRPLPEAAKAGLAAWAGVEAMVCTGRDDLAGVTDTAHSAVWPDLSGPLLDSLLQPGFPPTDCADLVWPAACAVAGSGWTEEVVTYGPGLVAQCTRPLSRAVRATVFLSSGAERRIGPHRLWVAYARERAAEGELCLRLDLAGLGESAARAASEPTARADVVYDARCVEDVRAALQWLTQTEGVTQVRLVGLCSGAYHAWRCAVSGLGLEQVVVITPRSITGVLACLWTRLTMLLDRSILRTAQYAP